MLKFNSDQSVWLSYYYIYSPVITHLIIITQICFGSQFFNPGILQKNDRKVTMKLSYSHNYFVESSTNNTFNMDPKYTTQTEISITRFPWGSMHIESISLAFNNYGLFFKLNEIFIGN